MAGHGPEQRTDVATAEQTRRTLIQAAAMLQDGTRKRAVAHGTRPQPTPATAPSHTQEPGDQRAPGRTTGGVA